MRESIYRIVAIGQFTFIEALRQRVLTVFLLMGFVLLLGSFFLTDLSFIDTIRFLKDLGYAAISLTGFLVALLGAALLIPGEINKRTIYTLLSKPVHRAEYILGKYLGLVALLTVLLVVMAGLFYGILLVKEVQEVAMVTQTTMWRALWRQIMEFMMVTEGKALPYSEIQKEMLRGIYEQTRDITLVQAGLLLWAKLCVITAISVFFSTVATSTMFILGVTFFIVIIGHLQSVARGVWLSPHGDVALHQELLLSVVAWLIPDFSLYNIIDEIVSGQDVAWAHTSEILLYSGGYVGVLLALAMLIFQEREL